MGYVYLVFNKQRIQKHTAVVMVDSSLGIARVFDAEKDRGTAIIGWTTHEVKTSGFVPIQWWKCKI